MDTATTGSPQACSSRNSAPKSSPPLARSNRCIAMWRCARPCGTSCSRAKFPRPPSRPCQRRTIELSWKAGHLTLSRWAIPTPMRPASCTCRIWISSSPATRFTTGSTCTIRIGRWWPRQMAVGHRHRREPRAAMDCGWAQEQRSRRQRRSYYFADSGLSQQRRRVALAAHHSVGLFQRHGRTLPRPAQSRSALAGGRRALPMIQSEPLPARNSVMSAPNSLAC